ncbi:TetR/AcrR family transcriptional regulator [Mycolicibacterium confluentis]|uniref:TetR family transcriptional regulator n=1 Tax=Mycolicibacterium confluentis TaxID=28047 RepID=A0A7I7XTU8_9MYCO|nr:TetR/AcrR family transcriptional regulator [Mycolicibacterium confluentis]MCV7322053.1 TetR/AcrR family transcriptional regulator [Mycolicibacterium confluentis]ORV27831.1 TetR family transcriptional regulator [Mycolicibacterium confluentis]BBZ32533.1 TetR family transcriptional regulator [Mycolicibacterium confluentis]
MTSARPYATLLAKGEDRKIRILAAAQRLLTRNGWRNTTLSQIAKEAGVSAAGLLHHFDSKEQLLHAVVDARDADDDAHADRSGDLLEQLANVGERVDRNPELVGTYSVLLVENLMPDAPLHDRMFNRHRAAVRIVADLIRRGQESGRYRSDIDPALKAVQIVSLVNGMEISWLLDPSIPLQEALREYAKSLAQEFAPEATS